MGSELKEFSRSNPPAIKAGGSFSGSCVRGHFDHALGKFQDAEEVTQHGNRGQARYSVGKGNDAVKRGPGRPKKTPTAKETPAPPAEGIAKVPTIAG